MVCLQSVKLCYGLHGIWPIRFEDSIRKRIGRPIRFEIRFEQKKTDSQVPNTDTYTCGLWTTLFNISDDMQSTAVKSSLG